MDALKEIVETSRAMMAQSRLLTEGNILHSRSIQQLSAELVIIRVALVKLLDLTPPETRAAVVARLRQGGDSFNSLPTDGSESDRAARYEEAALRLANAITADKPANPSSPP